MKTEIDIKITPELMAKQFWNMGSDEQAEFFHCLADVINENHKTNLSAYSFGEMQWLYMHDDVKKRSKQAYNMYLALSSFAFEHWPRKPDICEINT